MKKSKIIAPALGVLVLSTAASISGTVAWFTANNSVQVTGMTINTKTGSNVLIAADTLMSSASPSTGIYSDATFVDNVFSSEAVNQTVSATLEPVSTTTATSFFYTVNAIGSGDAKTDSYTAYSEAETKHGEPLAVDNALANYNARKDHFDKNFVKAYTGLNVEAPTPDTVDANNVVYGYVDYSFYLRATYVSNSNTYLFMDTCDLKYAGEARAATDRAWRIAVFAHKETLGTYATDAAVAVAENRKTILATANAVNFTNGQAVTSTSATGSVTYGTAALLDTVSTPSTAYYKVVVRLWLEGEDNTCNVDTYRTLTSNYSLDLGFSIASTTGGVTVIG